VQDKRATLFESRATELSDVLLKTLVDDKVVLQAFLGTVTDKVAANMR
jgi:hypothetical protein